MARVLIFWRRPPHLSREEAQEWVLEQLGAFTDHDAVARAELTAVEPAGARYQGPGDWMLELHLRPDADHAACVEAAGCAELLADLRLLGMDPSAVIADGGLVVRAQDD
jgi:hypothetical protein